MIITLNDLKSYMGITDSSSDGVLTTIIDGVNEYIESEYGPFEQITATELLNGRGTKHLKPSNSPIISLTTLQYNKGTVSSPIWEDYDADNYVLSNNIITVLSGSHPRGYNNIKVVYEAGYESIPGDVIQAALDLCSYKFNNKGSEGISREKVDDVEIQYKDDTTKTVLNILSKYKKIYV